MKRYIALFAAVVLLVSLSASGDAPDNSFLKFEGQMYGEAAQGQPAHHSHQSLTINIPPNKMIDASWGQGNIACCGGDENRNANTTHVPNGIYVEIGGGNAGEWGVFNIERSSITSDETGELKGYKVSADLYCGPSAMHGGCNVHLYAWVKLKQRPAQ